MYRKILIFFLILVISTGVVSASDDVNDTLSIEEAADSPNQPITNNENNNSNIQSDFFQISEDDDLSDGEGEFVDVSEAYEYLNQFRCEEGVWQWDSDDTTKTYFNTGDTIWLHPILRDVELENTAKIRAKELYALYSHTRPDGTPCTTVFPEGLISMGENIAMGQTSCADAIEVWKETDDHYDGQGHRRNMLDPEFNYVGIAGYKIGGVIYWVQDFGCRHNPAEEVSGDVFGIESNNSKYPKFTVELPRYATGNFVVNVGGHELMRKALFQGKAEIVIYGLDAGIYDVELIYEGDHNYKPVNKTESISTTGDGGSNVSLTYLNTLIKMSDDVVKLQKDYSFDSEMDSDFINGIVIPESITIDGQGHTIDAKGQARIFTIVDGAKLKNVKLINGVSSSYGGAILSYYTVDIYNCTFISNSAGKYGGAIYSVNQIHCYDSKFTDNNASFFGGALFGEAAVIVSGSSFINNKAGDIGGGIYAQYTLSSENSIYINNTNLQRYSPRLIIGNGNSMDDEYSKIFTNVTQNNSVVNLNKDLTATQTILINASNVIINGNGHSINAQNRTRIFFITGNNITIKNITLSAGNSLEGGAIYASSNDISIIDSTIENNYAETGAAISTVGNVFVRSSNFIDNTANAGGAIFSDKGNITILDSLFRNNDALVHGGGAIYTTAKVNITHSVFTDNDAELYGGVVFTNGKELGKVYIVDSIFANNTSKKQGGVFLANLGAEISDSTFQDNKASDEGGVICTWGDVKVSHSNFTGNSAGKGGVLYVYKGSTAISNSNFISNDAKNSGGAIESKGGISISGSVFTDNGAKSSVVAVSGVNIEISNSDFTNNGGENSKTFSGTVTGSNSKIIENGKDVSSKYINSDGQNGSDDSSGGSSADSSSKTDKIIKKSTKITAKKKTFKVKAKSKKYTITLKAGLKAVKKVRVFLKIKGKTIKATTNNKGKATFYIKLKKKGTFKATITFKGDKNYNKCSKTIKIKFK